MKKRALISVSDKTGIIPFAQKLIQRDYEILSTGGTAKLLLDAGVPVTKVSDVTGFPEIMDGRVKTLHPLIHGGILGLRDNKEHVKTAENLGIHWIDMVVVNLYPFEETLKRSGVSHAEMIENIDIGGPTMIRAAAKNYRFITVVVDPEDYANALEALSASEDEIISIRQRLAGKAFAHTARYDTLISAYFNRVNEICQPETLQTTAHLKEILRYGENPHQLAAYYEDPDLSAIEQLHGKQLSYNNYLDIDAALRMIRKFPLEGEDSKTVGIFKHTNPCGIGSGSNLVEAYEKAFATDTLSPFGGIVITNDVIDMDAALKINEVFTEIILAPAFTDEAIQRLMKKKDRRLIRYDIGKLYAESNQAVSCMNGVLLQGKDIAPDDESGWRIVTKRKPDETEMKALRFAWKTVALLKSNAVCFTRDDRSIGLGIGQTSRIDSTEIAIHKADKFGLSLEDCACGSDGFFPFRDSIDSIHKLGIRAVIQPGGSRGDQEVIDACDEYGITMIMTGTRHFRH